MFSNVAAYPGDPILSLAEEFSNDPRVNKVNLGIGIYSDATGSIPVLQSVRTAQNLLHEKNAPSPYLPMEGSANYREQTGSLLFGQDFASAKPSLAVVQTLGGSGALKLGAEFLKRYFPNSGVHVSDPTWDNHIGIFEGTGLRVSRYRYYNVAQRSLDFDGMLQDLSRLAPREIVLLHPCCHNPTGVDPSEHEWLQIIDLIEKRKLIAFVDMAYQGFAEGLQQDAFVIRELARRHLDFAISNSFSKTFSLYGERCGALTIHCASAGQSVNVLGQLKLTIRRSYSNPPTYGMRLISIILGDPVLRSQWECELGLMRTRIAAMRVLLRERLNTKLPLEDFSFLTQQRGMFAYTGLTLGQANRLKIDFGVYILSTGRICIAGLREDNVEYVANAFAAVLAQ
jgi:aromatic-amino-acid transaminase